jgi:succinate dehydrogenase/fumarate reductase flavoprotein subunit
MSEKNRFRVIIIGGGLAGLSAANHLVKIFCLKMFLFLALMQFKLNRNI